MRFLGWRHAGTGWFQRRFAPSAGFEPALMAPEATALSPELRGRVSECTAFRRSLHNRTPLRTEHKSLQGWLVSAVQSSDVPLAANPGIQGRPVGSKAGDHRSLGSSIGGRPQRTGN